MKNPICTILTILALVGLAGCQPAASDPTPAPGITVTPALPATLAPTATSAPTQAASPTPFTPGLQPHEAVVVKELDEGTLTWTIPYLLYLPESYGQDPQKKWPLILFLHGSMGRGSDLDIVRGQTLPTVLKDKPDFPFIVVAPQLAATEWTWAPWIDGLDGLLTQLESELSVDPDRFILTGFSLGGIDSWDYALQYPDRFAALVPVAGGYPFAESDLLPQLCSLNTLPIWIFHSEMDYIVHPGQTYKMIETLDACDANLHVTLYTSADHVGTAMTAYAEEELFTWLLEQKR
ncbi:MAG: hypothetical protein EHM70_13555 [Chloroflexota bacterium]|nr:MAG: hypothetical protein EHM70_13555 [Chloroflexota bacterium]